MNHFNNTVETTAVAAANKATWAGSAMTMVSGVAASDIGMWAGIIIGVAGLVISWFFKYRADARYQEANARYAEAHNAYMSNIRYNKGIIQPPRHEPEESL